MPGSSPSCAVSGCAPWAAGLLRRDDAPLIMLEYSRASIASFGYAPEEIPRLLGEAGYRCAEFRDGAILPFDEKTECATVVAIRPCHAAMLGPSWAFS
jgi:hypothetical protein